MWISHCNVQQNKGRAEAYEDNAEEYILMGEEPRDVLLEEKAFKPGLEFWEKLLLMEKWVARYAVGKGRAAEKTEANLWQWAAGAKNRKHAKVAHGITLLRSFPLHKSPGS